MNALKENQVCRVTQAALPEQRAGNQKYVLRLYIAGITFRSTRAIASLKHICETYLKGRYDLNIIDIYQQPALASQHQIIATPTLIKESPAPPCRFIGDLSDQKRVLTGLNLNLVN